MTFDRDEQFLHEKLSTDLHPAPVDLWPAVAENLPAKPHRRHLWLCLAAPLLIAAGVAATGAQFTDLRTNPRPSFAPDATAGYAISYERQYYTLPADLWAGMQANHNLETAADGTPPRRAESCTVTHLSQQPAISSNTLQQSRPRVRNLVCHGRSHWACRWRRTRVLDAGEAEPAVRLLSQDHRRERLLGPNASSAQVGFVPVGNEAP